MAITRVGTGIVSTSPITLPTVSGGILPTDYIVIDAWNTTSTAPSTPSGYTSGATGTAGGSSPAFRQVYRKAAGGEDGNTVAITNAAKAVAFVYRGVDNTTPIDVAASPFGTATGAASMAVNSLTTTKVGVCLHLTGLVNTNSVTFTRPTLPATFTEVIDEPTQPASTVDELIWSGSGATNQGGATVITQTGSTRYATSMLALRPADVPAQVGTVSHTAGDSQVVLTWSAPSDGGYPITDYVVQWRTNAGPGSWNTFADGTSTSTGATVTGLTNGTAYDFQVAAVNAIGTGTYSAAVTDTPASAGSLVPLARTRARRRSPKRR